MDRGGAYLLACSHSSTWSAMMLRVLLKEDQAYVDEFLGDIPEVEAPGIRGWNGAYKRYATTFDGVENMVLACWRVWASNLIGKRPCAAISSWVDPPSFGDTDIGFDGVDEVDWVDEVAVAEEAVVAAMLNKLKALEGVHAEEMS